MQNTEKQLNEKITNIVNRLGNSTGSERIKLQSQYDILARERKQLSDEKLQKRHFRLKDL
ncbi:MAG: hypothetical protein J6R32_00350 [Bacteroidales bacterium]|nr:hypothetical protein [Bacteroidales bacterium]